VRLFALTGYGTEADREQARAAGFDVHLAKPVDPHAVEALLTARDA
jgi:CheY-like chemotaxis protein